MMIVVQTCIRCGLTKVADGNFKRSAQAKSGHVKLCHDCRAAEHAAVADLTCERCHVTMPAAGNFGRSTNTKTGYQYKCLNCIAAEREYWEEQARERRAKEHSRLLLREPTRGLTFRPGQLIYTLSDPRDGAVRYVGRTVNAKARYNKHINDQSWYPHWQNGELVFGNTKVRWIRELIRAGLRPVLTIVEEVDPPELVPEREYRWIFHYLYQGAPLTNDFVLAHPKLVSAIKSTPLDYLHEPLHSECWTPLALVKDAGLPTPPPCCATSSRRIIRMMGRYPFAR